MRGVNKAIIVGTLGQDPESRDVNGNTVCNFSVATNERWKDKNSGEQRESTEWHRIVIWGRLADVAAQYLTKGSQVYLEGKIQTRKWQGQDGQDRYTTEINVQKLEMLGGRGDKAPQDNAPRQQAPQRQEPQQSGFDQDDIPF